MTQAVAEAIYDHGSLRLVEPVVLPIRDGQRVRVVVTPQPDVLDLAAEVYGGLSDEEIRKVESIALNRDHFFSRPTP